MLKAQATPPEPTLTRAVDEVSPWVLLEEDSHLSDVQDMIRHAIGRGSIRVVPGVGGRVRIVRDAATVAPPIEANGSVA